MNHYHSTRHLFLVALMLVAGLAAAPGSAYAQGDISGCKFTLTQQLVYEMVSTDHHRLTGTLEQPAQINCDEIQLFADKIEVFRSEGRLAAEGHVVFVSGTNRISAERLDFNTRSRTGTFYTASGTAVMKEGTPGESAGEQEPYAFFWGDELHKVGPTKYKIVRGGFTACVQPTPRWEISSGTLTLNLDDYVLLKNALFKVKGVPLLYLPVFYYPMQEDDRATGFLMPTYGTATIAGQKITNAFFWAMGRSHDATFTHDWFTKTGQGMGGEYRYVLGGGSRGNARVYRLNEKEVTSTQNGVDLTRPAEKSFTINGDLVQTLGGGLRARGYADYFSTLTTQQKYQQNVFQATNRTRRYGANLTGSWAEYVLNATFDQRDIFDASERLVRDANLPRVSISRGERALGKSPLYFGATAEYVTFVRKTIVDDETAADQGLSKLDFNPTLRVPFTKLPFLTVNSVVSWRGTFWTESLNTSGVQVPESIRRSYFDFQARITGPVFHRIWDRPGSGYAEKIKHVIEPTLSIQRTTAVDNFRRIVVLESSDHIVGNTTRYTYGVTNRIYAKKETSREIVNVGVSQSYYTDARAALYDQNYLSSSGLTDSNFSPVAITARIAPTLGIQGTFRTEWDTQVNAIRTIATSGTINSGKWLQAEAGWSQRRVIKELPDFDEARSSHYINATATLRTPRNSVGGTYSFNYDLRQDQFLQQRYMWYYNAQCCGVAVEWQSFNLPAGFVARQDRRFNISVTLAGIGAVPSFFGALSGQQNRR